MSEARTVRGLVAFLSSSHLEKWLSLSGGLVGILGVMLVSQASLGLSGSASLVASMGASAVLLFAVPHGPLSQPWPVFGGHLVSALIGVACAKLVTQPFMTAPLAVALAIGAMHYLRCIHPPGGATALTAAAGGDAVQALGFNYVVTPVLLNVLIILLVAVLFNLPFAWRRYPARWARNPDPQPAILRTDTTATPGGTPVPDTSGDGSHAHGEARALQPVDVRHGGYYCNGAFGPHWQVRQVIASAAGADDAPLTYRVVAGAGRRRSGTASRAAFAQWACYEVIRNESSWQRVGASHPCPAVLTGTVT